MANLYREHSYIEKDLKQKIRLNDINQNIHERWLKLYYDCLNHKEMSYEDLKFSLENIIALIHNHFQKKVYVLIDDYDFMFN